MAPIGTLRELLPLLGAAALAACGSSASDAGSSQTAEQGESPTEGQRHGDDASYPSDDEAAEAADAAGPDVNPIDSPGDEPPLDDNADGEAPGDDAEEEVDSADERDEPAQEEAEAEVEPPPLEREPPPIFVEEQEAEVLVDPVDALECEDGTPGCGCEPVSFRVATRASCDMQLVEGAEVDGTAFLHGSHLVFVMNRWGSGHIIGWCDATTSIELMEAFPGWAYLGQTEEPRIAVMGSHWGCEQRMPGYPFWANEMPQAYVDDPAKLAEDYDVIMICGYNMGLVPNDETVPENPEALWPTHLQPVLTSFVKEHGKGLFMVMDYHDAETNRVVKEFEVDNMNAIVRDAGFEFVPSSVDWGDAAANFTLECVADVPRVR